VVAAHQNSLALTLHRCRMTSETLYPFVPGSSLRLGKVFFLPFTFSPPYFTLLSYTYCNLKSYHKQPRWSPSHYFNQSTLSEISKTKVSIRDLPPEFERRPPGKAHQVLPDRFFWPRFHQELDRAPINVSCSLSQHHVEDMSSAQTILMIFFKNRQLSLFECKCH
jgi:hypothetical protein